MKLQRLVSLLSLCFLLAQPTTAQNYSGTYTAADLAGNPVTLVLQRDAQGQVTGSFSAGGLTFRVQGTVEDEDLFGTAVGDAGSMYLEAYEEDGEIELILAELGPNNQPNFDAASEIVLLRQGSASNMPVQPSPGGPPTPSQPPTAQAPTAATAQDQQLIQLLLSSKWCSFSYSGVSGTSSGRSTTESFLFMQNGTALVETGGESYYGGDAGSVAGQRGASGQLRWRVNNGELSLSTDGTTWQTVDLRVSYNSNGYPILNADQKEYAQCS